MSQNTKTRPPARPAFRVFPVHKKGRSGTYVEEDLDHGRLAAFDEDVVLIRVWQGTNWSYPHAGINSAPRERESSGRGRWRPPSQEVRRFSPCAASFRRWQASPRLLPRPFPPAFRVGIARRPGNT